MTSRLIVTILACGLAAGANIQGCASTDSTCEDRRACPEGGSSGTAGATGGDSGAAGEGGVQSGGTAGSAATGGTSGSGAGQGGSGGSEPCNGECEPPTPVCLEATDTCVECTGRSHCETPRPACDTDENVCVECLESTDCDDPTPVCDTDAQECVECLESTDCDDPTPVCDTDAQECAECLESEDCTDATASRCTSTNTCAACMGNADCAHIPGKNVCDGGTCVQCTGTNESACGANSCNPAAKTCTMTARGSISVCKPCLADSECIGGNQADPDQRCVPMEFQSVPRPGGYCMTRVAKSCTRPFTISLAAISLSGSPMEEYCGIDMAVTRCEAVLDLLESRPCPDVMDTSCGCARDTDGNCIESGSGQGGACRVVGVSANQCTYACGVNNHCPMGTSCPIVGPKFCQ